MNFRKIQIPAACLLAVFSLAVSAATGAPDCKLKTLDQARGLQLQDFQGQVVYVDFWASWCGPCARSFPFMNQLHHDFQDKGLKIVAVNLDENIEEAKAFLTKIPAEFTIALDPDQQCAMDFSVQAMPSSYLVDKKGNIRHTHLGFRQGQAGDLRKRVEQLLTESNESAAIE